MSKQRNLMLGCESRRGLSRLHFEYREISHLTCEITSVSSTPFSEERGDGRKMAHLTRTLGRQGWAVSQRALSTTAAQQSALSTADKDKFYPKIGNRDIVGYGFNGNANYMDRPEYPAPAIRFKENTDDVLALREKEKGDWKALSLEDKKALYRASFCQTYSEMRAPTGEWKAIVAGIFLGLSITGWAMIFMKQFVYPPLPSTINREWMEANLENMVRQRQGAVTGVSSQYDYEKGDWK